MLLRHCPCTLDEFGQPRRNAGDCRDQNFFWRTLVRASARMRKKKRKTVRNSSTEANVNTGPDQRKDQCCSTNRKKDLLIDGGAENDSKTKALVSCEASASALDEPHRPECINNGKKLVDCSQKTNNCNDTQVSFISGSESDTLLLGPDESILNDERDSVFLDCTEGVHEIPRTDSTTNSSNPGGQFVQGMTLLPAAVEVEKTDMNNTQPSVDNSVTPNKTSGTKFSINRSKRTSSKQKLDKTPTPPPRSPLSLGLTPDVFQFPPVSDEHTKISRSPSESPSSQTGRSCTTISESCTPDHNVCDGIDTSVIGNSEKSSSLVQLPTTPSEDGLKEESETVVDSTATTVEDVINTNTLNTDYGSPENCAYQNLPNFKQQGNQATNQFIDLTSSHGYPKQNNNNEQPYDPLSFEAWIKSTGDGKVVVPNRTQSDSTSAMSDYVNLESPHCSQHSDDEDNSYVNFAPCSMVLPDIRKTKKKGKKMRSISLQDDFARYDDDDPSVYHPVKALDQGYENFNGMTNHSRNYCTKLLSPSTNTTHVNYVDVIGLPAAGSSSNNNQRTNTALDAHQAPIMQMKNYNKSDYTRIDAAATVAIQQTMDAYRQERDDVNPLMTHPGTVGGKEPRCRKEITVK